MVGANVNPVMKERNRKCKTRLRMIEAGKEFASETTIHGISYIASTDHSLLGRIFWLITVILALILTSLQLNSLLTIWKYDPVVTTLDTIAMPIEEIEFPAVTVCPQGTVSDIMENVMFQQLREYIQNKSKQSRQKRSDTKTSNHHGKDKWNVTYDEMMEQINEFLKDVYPGANDNPIKLVSAMVAPDPEESIKNEAIIIPKKKTECNETSNQNILDKMNKQLNHDFCKEGFEKHDNFGCIFVSKVQMTYEDASNFCHDIDDSSILLLNSYAELSLLGNIEALGIYRYADSD